MIIKRILEIAKKTCAKVALGVREEYLDRTLAAVKIALKNNYAKIVLVGQLQALKNNKSNEKIEYRSSLNPEKELISLLKNKEVEAVVRGSVKATYVLTEIKKQLNPRGIHRIALLSSGQGKEFFFAPVGIDEGRGVDDKIKLIEAGVKLVEGFELKPKVAVLSGGRIEDIGRNWIVDKTIKEADLIVNEVMRRKLTNNIKHYEILIEKAIEENVNIVLAPDGVSGNLVYRTLVHLGNGKSYGAPLYGIKYYYVDTSRVGPVDEYVHSIALASALTKLKTWLD